jgi:hypothetical protein
MSKLTARLLMDNVFYSLVQLVETKKIKAGTAEEFFYLKNEMEIVLKRFAVANIIDAPCKITVKWTPYDANALEVTLDKVSVKKFKERNLYD